MLSQFLISVLNTDQQVLKLNGIRGPGQGHRVVLISGDEEYRSEEALPQLAKILSKRHGFQCTVLFSLNSRGEIDPTEHHNEPGLEALKRADLCIMLLRFREWPDEQMEHFVNYYLSGKPILALRTSTHAFSYSDSSESLFKKYSYNSKVWPGGFGENVLGSTWISHWGNHGQQGTRGVIENAYKSHPLLYGVKEIFCTTDVYESHPPIDSKILIRGEVTETLDPNSPPSTTTRNGQNINNPMMPIFWTRKHKNEQNNTNEVITTTMGSATDLLNPGFRRLLVNSTYWLCGMKSKIKPNLNVDIVLPFEPSPFGFGKYRQGHVPADLEKSGQLLTDS